MKSSASAVLFALLCWHALCTPAVDYRERDTVEGKISEKRGEASQDAMPRDSHPGGQVFGFASMCELTTSRNYCSLAKNKEDPFCQTTLVTRYAPPRSSQLI